MPTDNNSAKDLRPTDNVSSVYDEPLVPKTVDMYDDDTVDPVYRAKAHVLNDAMQGIGMGRYQVPCVRNVRTDVVLTFRS